MNPRNDAPADAVARRLAVAERARNVVLDAGAGTGKTTILVERLIQLVAPADDGPAFAFDRIAAITFTRRAAGELRLRVRGRLIEELATEGISAERRARLRAALSTADTAYIGTIHSFADRLLRMRPSAARLSPSYEVVDDREALVAETARLLLHGAARGTLAQRLQDRVVPELLREATETIGDALQSGLRAVRRQTEFWIDHGLDSLVRGFVDHRDVDAPHPDPWMPDRDALAAGLTELADLGETHGESSAAIWFRRLGGCARRIPSDELRTLFSDVAAEIYQRRRSSYKLKLGHDCEGDREVWRRWKRLDEGGLGDAIVMPLHRWMATRLLRVRPIVLALYEDVKQRRGVLDEIDLLLRLRNVMRDDLATRAFYKAKFDHVFVDEFQDTDPLQAEILLYLTEGDAPARSLDEVSPAAGRITIVGDPQQSIYRFRRADVATYASVCTQLGPDALRLELTSNFRSTPALVDWGNDRFREIFGAGAAHERFDASRGRVFHRDLVAGRADEHTRSTSPLAAAPVHVLPLVSDDKLDADEWRDLEAQALPRYLQWLVERSDVQIGAPDTNEPRRIAWGDICVLAMSTFHLHRLFAQLDALGIPYTTSGGTLFLDDPLQRLFILALRALADPTDGPAAAALRRPPFFATNLGQLAIARAGVDPHGVVAAMETAILELRRDRFQRSPGETARMLLERSCLGAAIAVGTNGAQRLARLRELCHLADMLAFEEALDYDGVTARMRSWIDDPEAIDAPPPVRPRAVQVMTIHQAKGLEFPVVVLWDARAQAEIPAYPSAWQVTRDGRQWMIKLDGLEASEPPGRDLGAIERALLDEERRRLSYVAVTRARDLLVIPRAGAPDAKLLWRPLSDTSESAVHEAEPYVAGRGATWAAAMASGSTSPDLVADESLEVELAATWHDALDRTRRASIRTMAVTTRAHRAAGGASTNDEGRYGPRFGSAVHRAIALVLAEGDDIAAAATRCCERLGVPVQWHAEVEADVRRTVETVRALGFAQSSMQLEYPIAGAGAQAEPGGELLVGAIDLLLVDEHVLWVVDFKTDAPPRSDAAAEFPAYAMQVQLYAELLHRCGVAGTRTTKRALLFTADGSFHQIDEPLDGDSSGEST